MSSSGSLIVYLGVDDDLRIVMQKVQDAALEVGIPSDHVRFAYTVEMDDLGSDEEAGALVSAIVERLNERGRGSCGWSYGEDGVGETVYGDA